ncbi:MAG: hypothetical protein IJZ21_02420 [Clostridia bacterium]|nr:hypothetical protein [Clostridia bacterium]
MKRKIDFITVAACSLVSTLLAVMFFIIPDKELSEKENRALQEAPAFSVGNLFSGEYTADLAGYISDQFPERDTFVAIKAYSELLLGKRENNGIIYGKNNALIAKVDSGDRLRDNLDAVKEFENATGTPVYLGILPSTADVFSEKLPSCYSTESNDKIWQQFFTQAENLNLKFVNLYDPLCKQNNYYRTDHHYTTFGAYQTYELLSSALGFEVKSIDFFEREIVSRDFCGTSMRTSAFYLTPKDEITLFRYDGDADYNVVADSKDISLYDMSKLDTTDQYAVFLGGNHARVDISSGENKPKLLIIRDSFADSLAPFLALHYDLTLIDLRYYSDNVQQLVLDENFDCVLILESITEFSSAKNISYLRMAVSE